MEAKLIFVSVGSTCNAKQEDFVKAVEDRLRLEGLVPQTVGRNTFSADAPLKAVTELMDKCSGIMVIALERNYFPSGTEKRGGNSERSLENIKLATPWNHIEAAMAYSRHLPIFVITEEGLKAEGLLEPGYDWFVLSIPLDPASLSSPKFNGILSDWKGKISNHKSSSLKRINPGEMSVAELLGSLKPVQLWSLLIAMTGLVVSAFTLGLKLQEISPKHNNAIHQSHPLGSLSDERGRQRRLC
jgi:hypothetical protein